MNRILDLRWDHMGSHRKQLRYIKSGLAFLEPIRSLLKTDTYLPSQIRSRLDLGSKQPTDSPHYAHRLDQLRIIPGSEQAIRLLNAHNFHVIVISNQSGVNRSYYQEEDVKTFNDGIEYLLAKEGAHIDAVYYCPHHPDVIIESYKIDCDCREPKPEMILQKARMILQWQFPISCSVSCTA